MSQQMTGARILVQALRDQGVDTIFGYPGGAVLPIYDEIFQQNDIRHVLVRHEQGAVHMAEGYARSTGKVGVVMVTSGPGATNAVTGMTNALMDSVPVVVISGQVPTFLIGTDGFQEADTVGITRPCTKHNWLVKDPAQLAHTVHRAFQIAASGRPGPVLIDIPKDVQVATADYDPPAPAELEKLPPAAPVDHEAIAQLVDLIERAERPILYTGGGVINSGPEASRALREFADASGFPVTSSLMGLGAYPASGKQWIGMLGMHGLFEANWAMHDCDLMIALGTRFDDRITGRVADFSPGSIKAQIDIDRSSINKIIHIDLPIVGDVGAIWAEVLRLWTERGRKVNREALTNWWHQIERWRAVNCLAYKNSDEIIKPQYALQRLEALTRDREDRYITTEVGQHQMWAAQFMGFEQPNRLMTSGGLGTMGYGLPASIGVQIAHPDALVINVAGEASWLMNMQEMGTAVQFRAPVKQFILNNERLGMVRQWQQLLYESRYSQTWSESLPDFVKMAEAFGCRGRKVEDPADLDDAIREMIEYEGPFILDVLVERHENCFPMIPSGKPHNEMILGDAVRPEDISTAIGADGAMMV